MDGLDKLFASDELVAFREPAPTHRTSFSVPTDRSEFFCINPVIEAAPITLSNIAAYRNLLVEYDQHELETQLRHALKIKLPFAVCTFSGSKSLHFILAMSPEDSATSEADYNKLAKMIFAIVKRCDSVNINPNRLTRLPGAMRKLNNGEWIEQSLIKLGAQTSKSELIEWAKQTDPIAYNNWLFAERELEKAKAIAVAPIDADNLEPLSATSQQLVYHGAIAPDRGRHEALQKLCSEMLFKGYHLAKIEELLYQAQDAIGLERDDVPSLMRWAQRKA